jgi:hypothetical protein
MSYTTAAVIDDQNRTRYTVHTDDPRLTVGTYLIGTIKTPYEALVQAFGAPGRGDGQKVQCEWSIKQGGESEPPVVATIYDWKQYAEPHTITEWHVGGYDSRAVALVREILGI